MTTAPGSGSADRGVEVSELLTPGPARALAGLLGVGCPDLEAGRPLPLLWHWVYLLDRPPQAALGADGHRASGGAVLPPGPGRRRMFAGGRVWSRAGLVTGAPAARRTWVSASADKHGRSGPMTLVTVRTEVRQHGQVALIEEQDLAYREAAPGPPGSPVAGAGPGRAAEDAGPGPDGAARFELDTGPVLLFRFSALTYNGHRIHYDRDYARQAEGYPGLVVHGPLQALAMAELARRSGSLPAPALFSFRLVEPLFEGQGLVASAVPEPGGAVSACVTDRSGRRTATGRLSTDA